MTFIILLALSGCAVTYPDGAVSTGEQAIAIAQRECGETGLWRATLKGNEWQVVWREDGAFIVTIDAQTGKTSGCTVVTK